LASDGFAPQELAICSPARSDRPITPIRRAANAILESVEQLSAEGMAVLYTTHYMEEAERLCDRIGIVDLGELKAQGTRAVLVGLVGEHDRVSLTSKRSFCI
jgi:ABC-type multidrug transport system ATPase subunit